MTPRTPMSSTSHTRCMKLRNSERGATPIEYIVFLALLILAAIAAVSYVGYRKISDRNLDVVDPYSLHRWEPSPSPSPEPLPAMAPWPIWEPSPEPSSDTSQSTINRSTGASPAFGTSTPTPAPAASTPRPAPAEPVAPTPGVEPPHVGPPDWG